MSKWLDYGPILSYQRFFTILTGGRGIGKTYGIKKIIIKRFKEKGEQFVWIRRYKPEKAKATQGFFNKIKVEFPDDVLEVRGDKFYINDKLAGVCVALSQNATNKGNDILDNCRTAVFDEYIIKTGSNGRYLPQEMTTLFDLLETFFRLRSDARLFVLSNNISQFNPLYLYFGLDFRGHNFEKWVDDDVYAENLATPEELIEEKANTPIGRITKKYDKNYYEYNVNNKVLQDKESFIAEKDSTAHQCMTLYLTDDDVVFIYRKRDKLNGGYKFYVDDKGQLDYVVCYTFDLNKASDDCIFVDKTNLSLPIKEIANSYKRGRLFFKNQKLKSLLTEELKRYF